MKLKKAYLLISILLFSNLFNIQTYKTGQLFDIISNDGKETPKSTQMRQEIKNNSIFDSVNSDEEQQPIIFNQLSLKETKKSSEKSAAKASLFSEIESEGEDSDKPEKISQEIPEKANPNPISTPKVKENEEKTQSALNSKIAHEPVVPGMTPVSKSSETPSHNSSQTKKEGPHHEETKSVNSHEENKVKSESKAQTNSNDSKSLEEPNPNKNLKNQITALLEMNERLLKRIQTHNNSHRRKNNKNIKMLSFIQKYESDLKNLKNNYVNNQSFIQKTLYKKDEEIKNLYKQTEHIYGDLQNKLEKVNNQMHHISDGRLIKNEKLPNEPSFVNVDVDENLYVKGISDLNKVNAKQVNLGGVNISANEIGITDENTKITFGNESLSVADLFENMKAVKKVLKLCGNNFENCLRKEEELHERQFSQQKEILESLKNLRSQTAEILTNHRKRLR